MSKKKKNITIQNDQTLDLIDEAESLDESQIINDPKDLEDDEEIKDDIDEDRVNL